MGVPKTATQAEIKKAFKKLAIKHHPDRGGDAEKFKEINAAHEVLGDPEKREMYDKYGLEGLKGMSEGGQGGFGDIFDMFFGGGRRNRGQRQQPQMKPTVVQKNITLHQAYHGASIQVEIQRMKICLDCNGKGGASVETCKDCKGQGVVIRMVQMGPGMYTQTQSHCDKCQGKGKIIEKGTQCKSCKTKGTTVANETVDLTIEPGFPNQEKLVVQSNGNEHPEYRTGDLVVVVQIEPHEVYKRQGNDLFMTKKIKLIDALKGFSFNLKHINDQTITISTPKGKVIAHEEQMRIPNLGMHHYKDSMSNGDLYIQFEVEFPKALTPEQIQTLETALPKGVMSDVKVQKNSYEMEEIAKGAQRNHGHNHHDMEEEEHEGGQRVECNSQ